MRRLTSLCTAAVVLFGIAAMSGSAAEESYTVRNCSQGNIFCAEAANSIGYDGAYTGHDEPSLAFYSDTPGSGNSPRYRLQLPTDPGKKPKEDGKGATSTFQLTPAFWVGMALCDNQSAPEYTHAPCVPDSDTNIFDGTDPAAPDYVGKHPGAALLEVQFYPPGWAPLPAAISCDAKRWCAAMAIFSLPQDQNTGALNNLDCLERVGVEPVNYAFITKTGLPHAPPDPLTVFTPPFSAFTPDPATDLFMNPGDVLTIDIHDGPDGVVATVNDETTHQSGSMTASAANGFEQVLFEPDSGTCHQAPYAFRPMYATSSEHTRVPWSAHTYNVAASEEIGHFEPCKQVDEDTGTCLTKDGGEDIDDDDNACFGKEDSQRVKIGGCLGLAPTDNDFDGVSYGENWPGTGKEHDHPTSFLFTSPLFDGSQNYSRVAFETALPRIEATDQGGNCDRVTGENCVNPPPGADFYPIYTTGTAKHDFFKDARGKGPKQGCVWQFGGPGIKGTTNTFGGNSVTEYGPLLFTFYPDPDPALRNHANNFRRVLDSNPCPAPTP